MKYCLIITLIRRLNIVVTLIIILSLVIQKCCRILLLIVFFIKYKELSNVSNMNLHGFRHSHATMMLEITNDVYNVSKRLGHENIEITDTYLHVNNKIQRIPKMVQVLDNSLNRLMITDNRSSEMVSTVEFLIVIIIFFQLLQQNCFEY